MASLVRPSVVAQVLAGARPRVHNVWRHISSSAAAGVGSRRGVAWQPLACSSWRQFSVVTAASGATRGLHTLLNTPTSCLTLNSIWMACTHHQKPNVKPTSRLKTSASFCHSTLMASQGSFDSDLVSTLSVTTPLIQWKRPTLTLLLLLLLLMLRRRERGCGSRQHC